VTSGAAGGRRALTGLAVTGVAVAALTVAACGGSAGPSGLAQAAGGSSPGGSSSPAAVSPATVPSGAVSSGAVSSGVGSLPAVEHQTAEHADPFPAAAAGYLAERSGSVLAAVYDLRTGQSWRLGDGPAQDEASVVKLDILETLLSGSDGAGLSPDHQALAQQMIEDSDNDAATSLWFDAGGTAGLAAYNAQAGLAGTTPSQCVQCADFAWPGWGLTTTVPQDQITLLKQLVMPSPLLTSAERGYALELLENVLPDQAWGISGGVPAGVTVALKDGWLPLNDAGTDWQVNSEGWVSGDGRDYLISVLSTGNPDEQYGIDTVSGLSSLVWMAMR
jgi:hypothetical protein